MTMKEMTQEQILEVEKRAKIAFFAVQPTSLDDAQLSITALIAASVRAARLGGWDWDKLHEAVKSLYGQHESMTRS